MIFHPDVLACHAQFGGDLESMQKCYDWPKLCDRITALEKENAELRKALEAIRDYPPADGRRTEDGYPLEVVYDEYAYRRIIDSYRAVARRASERNGE